MLDGSSWRSLPYVRDGRADELISAHHIDVHASDERCRAQHQLETPCGEPFRDLCLRQTLYVVHYIHRAIISPLVSSPKRTDTNIVVPLTAAMYNLL